MAAKTSTTADRRPDSQQLIRQWAILRLLSESPKQWSVKELSEQLQVSKATVERDLATLQRDFAVVEESAGKQKKLYKIDSKIRALETLKFGTTELLAVYAAQQSLAAMAGTLIHEDLMSVGMKIRGFLSPRHNGGLNALSRVFVTHVRGHVDYGSQQELIDDLVDAIAQRKHCKLTYHSPAKGTTRTHTARPLRLVWHRSSLYLFACLGEHDRITTLAVQRIQALEKLDERFTAPRLDVDDHVAKAFGIFVSDREEDVEVIFDKDVAWKVEERTFHPSERKERRPDGSMVYRLRSSAQWEVIPWVQTFGPFAELVAPATWRDALRANLDSMLARYASPRTD